MYSFLVLDTKNPIVLPSTLGIEVTIPEIAALCDLGNIDPQHSGVRLGRHEIGTSPNAAIDFARTWKLPPEGATLATLRPDLDSIGAMAMLCLRARRAFPVKHFDGWSDFDARALAISRADNFAGKGEWSPRALPTAEQPWTEGAAEDVRELAAIASIVADRKLTLGLRVATMAAWLLGGENPTDEQIEAACGATIHTYLQPGWWPAGPGECADMGDVRRLLSERRPQVEAERADMAAALTDGRISIVVRDGVSILPLPGGEAPPFDVHNLAVVRSAHRGAMACGYAVAPVVVAFHPAHQWPSGERTPKATIGFYVSPGAEKMAALRGALNAAERASEPIDEERESLIAGNMPPTAMRSRGEWGGNLASGILGSPQGRASCLSEEQIVAIVRSHLDQVSALARLDNQALR